MQWEIQLKNTREKTTLVLHYFPMSLFFFSFAFLGKYTPMNYLYILRVYYAENFKDWRPAHQKSTKWWLFHLLTSNFSGGPWHLFDPNTKLQKFIFHLLLLPTWKIAFGFCEQRMKVHSFKWPSPFYADQMRIFNPCMGNRFKRNWEKALSFLSGLQPRPIKPSSNNWPSKLMALKSFIICFFLLS